MGCSFSVTKKQAAIPEPTAKYMVTRSHKRTLGHSSDEDFEDIPNNKAAQEARRNKPKKCSMQYSSVVVVVHQARNLLAKDSNGFSDPYVVVDFGDIIKTSHIVPKCLNPVWDAEFDFLIGHPM